MSLPLKDLRAKISAETDAALEAAQQVSGEERSEIVRRVLHEWAMKQISAASVLKKIMEREGIAGNN